jgi:hypothetical protein
MLASWAKTPQELPIAREAGLRKTINQAIDIVNPIHYKRCPPAIVR